MVISRELYEMVRACQLKPSLYANYCIDLIKTENDIIVIEFLLNSLNNTVKKFTPLNKQNDLKKKFLGVLQEFYYTKFIDHKTTTVNLMLELINFKDHDEMEILLNFLKKLQIKTKNSSLLRTNSEIIELKDDYKDIDASELNLNTKKLLVKAIFEADYFNIDQKNELWQLILGESYNDKYYKYTLEAAQPDKNKKKVIWEKLVFQEGKEKSKINQAYMKGFACRSQYSLMKNYFHSKFFDDFSEVRRIHTNDYCLNFFKKLNPSFVIDDDILIQLEKLKNSLDKQDYQLISEVDKGKHSIFNLI